MTRKRRASTKRSAVRGSRGSRSARPPSRKALLEGLLAEGGEVLRSRLHRIREQIIDEPPGTGDEEDRRASYVSRELEIALLQLDAKTLRTVDTALRRLESGEYGRCDDCLKSIPPARLQALPFADLCVLCQEARESRAGEGGVGSRSGGRRSDRH